MKALILAAGLGTRLLPHTERFPKPLFSINGRPLLDHIIGQLIQAGCRAIAVNTHHLHDQIEAFIASRTYPVPVQARFEPSILGTGGAIKNLGDFWDQQPFMVINSDIFTNIDLRLVYDFHQAHPYPATLVMHDWATFNNVTVTKGGMICAFNQGPPDAQEQGTVRLAFTGIQVLDPEVLDYIPAHVFYSSIDAYRQLIENRRGVKAFIAQNHVWQDIGTPATYRRTACEAMVPEAFQAAFGSKPQRSVDWIQLKGDGSDRCWFRLSAGKHSLILADHGIRPSKEVCEADAFIAIGRHLQRKGLPVPRIFAADAFAGLVFLEDLGDLNLQQQVQHLHTQADLRKCYGKLIDLLVRMNMLAAEGFDPAFTYQTPTYDHDLIILRECRYFLNAFVNTYLGIELEYSVIAEDCELLAQEALQHAVTGFMHRDLQSRNIMVKDEGFFLIDFQGGRLGPLQYDLASLLLDPYTALPFAAQLQLLEYAAAQVNTRLNLPKNFFQRGFFCCALTRNLQILGAFGFLSRVKGKVFFEQYIPRAMESLDYYLNHPAAPDLPALKTIARQIKTRYTILQGG